MTSGDKQTMTSGDMLAQIDKLNKSQLRALRNKLAGRGYAEAIYVDERISKAIVTFRRASGDYAHHIMFGPRGRIIYHEIICA